MPLRFFTRASAFRSFAIVVVLMLSAVPQGCHHIESFEYNTYGNFDALWTIVDEHYCYFAEKDLDWKAIGEKYRAQITPETNSQQLFGICSDMLDELKDGHVNLISPWATSYYRKWWSDYPQNFDWRLIQEHYLNWDYTTGGGLSYKAFPDRGRGVGYVYYSSFAAAIGESFLDAMLMNFKDCKDGLIIDIRDNGGGDLTRVETLVARFLDKPMLAGYIVHKTGPGHDDFSEPYAFSYEPAYNHARWLRPVVILTNRSCYSAANNFVGIMKEIPFVTVVGDRTGGGGGLPMSSVTPWGWNLRLSASPVLDPQGLDTEAGIDPDEGCRVDMDPADAQNGIDTILEFAFRLLTEKQSASD